MKHPILETFKKTFGSQPTYTVSAPGRANIIGEHTDYNKGYVLPFAIDKAITFYAAKNDTNFINILANDVNEEVTIDINVLHANKDYGWVKFVMQVLHVLDKNQIIGFDMVFGSNLPIGAGISSSSALTCGFVTMLNQLTNTNLNAEKIMWQAINAERGYGVQGGIMDQYSIIHGKEGYALLLDCATDESTFINLNIEGHKFYLFNTIVKHNLLHTDYNKRRSECEKALESLKENGFNIKSLRDLEMTDLTKMQKYLDPLLYKRASYVIEENNRVLTAVEAINNNDFDALGQLLYQSHEGLALKYEVSCEELDYLVAYTKKLDEILGARMMGGGFGGCTINLVKGDFPQNKIDTLVASYTQTFGFAPDIFEVAPADGIIQRMAKNQI